MHQIEPMKYIPVIDTQKKTTREIGPIRQPAAKGSHRRKASHRGTDIIDKAKRNVKK
jgi:hypothetical protein